MSRWDGFGNGRPSQEKPCHNQGMPASPRLAVSGPLWCTHSLRADPHCVVGTLHALMAGTQAVNSVRVVVKAEACLFVCHQHLPCHYTGNQRHCRSHAKGWPRKRASLICNGSPKVDGFDVPLAQPWGFLTHTACCNSLPTVHVSLPPCPTLSLL